MQGHLDQYPDTQLVKTSHGGVPVYSSLVTCVLKTVFFLTFLYCIQCPGSLPLSYNTHTTLSNKWFSSIKDLATMPTGNGM